MSLTVSNIILYSLEFMAALIGTYYLMKTKDSIIKPFVYYLWTVLLLELMALYTYLVHSDTAHPLLVMVRDSPFRKNYWLYNVVGLILFNFVSQFYYRLMTDAISKRLIKVIIFSFNLGYVLYFAITKDLFTNQPYIMLIETFLYFIMTILYYRQLLLSHEIVHFYKETSFYIVTGLTLWYISVTPIFIFMDFYKAINSNFVQFRVIYFLAANIILYSCYTFGFLYTLRFKQK